VAEGAGVLLDAGRVARRVADVLGARAADHGEVGAERP